MFKQSLFHMRLCHTLFLTWVVISKLKFQFGVRGIRISHTFVNLFIVEHTSNILHTLWWTMRITPGYVRCTDSYIHMAIGKISLVSYMKFTCHRTYDVFGKRNCLQRLQTAERLNTISLYFYCDALSQLNSWKLLTRSYSELHRVYQIVFDSLIIRISIFFSYYFRCLHLFLSFWV